MLIAAHPSNPETLGTMMRTTHVLVAIALELSAALAAAQTCLGTASFSSGRVRLSAALEEATSHDKGYGVDIDVGAAGPFAGVGLTRAEYDGIEGAGTVFGAGAGYAINLNATKTVQFCPTAGFRYQTGPDVVFETTTIHNSSRGIGFGGSCGGVVRVAPTFDIVPFVDASYTNWRTRYSAQGMSGSESFDYGEIDVGAGFVINKTLTLSPSVSFPVRVEGYPTSFGLSVAFNFGGSSKR